MKVVMVMKYDNLTFHMHDNLLLNAFPIQSILGRTNECASAIKINIFNQQ